MKKNRRQS